MAHDIVLVTLAICILTVVVGGMSIFLIRELRKPAQQIRIRLNAPQTVDGAPSEDPPGPALPFSLGAAKLLLKILGAGTFTDVVCAVILHWFLTEDEVFAVLLSIDLVLVLVAVLSYVARD